MIECIKQDIEGVEVTYTRDSEQLEYKLTLKTDRKFLFECKRVSDTLMIKEYIEVGQDEYDSVTVHTLPLYVTQSDCYGYLFCNVLRVEFRKLSDNRELEDKVIKFICSLLDVAYDDTNIQVSTISRVEFNDVINCTSEDNVYNIFANFIISPCYLHKGKLYTITTARQCIAISLPESLLGLLALVQLKESDEYLMQYEIMHIFEVVVYLLGLWFKMP